MSTVEFIDNELLATPPYSSFSDNRTWPGIEYEDKGFLGLSARSRFTGKSFGSVGTVIKTVLWLAV
jgi:hypothetical protein